MQARVQGLMEASARSDAWEVHRLLLAAEYDVRDLQKIINRAQNAGCHEEINTVLTQMYRAADGGDDDMMYHEGEKQKALLHFEAASFRRLARARQGRDEPARAVWCVRCSEMRPADDFSAVQAALSGQGQPAFCTNRARHSRSGLGLCFGEGRGAVYEPADGGRHRRRRRIIIDDDDDDDDDGEPRTDPHTVRRSDRIRARQNK